VRKLPSLLQPRFFHPRYWLTWVGFGLAALLTTLPHRLQIGIGAGTGALAYRFARRRRHIVATNIRLCFPELDAQQQEQLVRRHLRSVGISLVETARVWIWNPAALRQRCTVHGLEHLQQAVAGGKGVLLLGMHLSTLDFCGAALGSYIDVDVMYRPNENPMLETVMTRGRMKNFPRAIEREDIRGVLHSLKQGNIVWYGADQDYGRRHSVFVPFFGVQAATITATARFARITGAAVVVLTHYRRADDNHYDIYLTPALEDFPSGDAVKDAARVSQLVEASVRPHPEQYWWVHHRFKTRPEGEGPLY
jgi:Kdo2-lipid IVA lauroyltransferase/acyltransferase